MGLISRAMLDYRAIPPPGRNTAEPAKGSSNKEKESTVHTIFKNIIIQHLLFSNNTVSACMCACVCRWTVQLLMVTTDYVSNNRFPITMVDEASTGVTALYNNQLVCLCECVCM